MKMIQQIALQLLVGFMSQLIAAHFLRTSDCDGLKDSDQVMFDVSSSHTGRTQHCRLLLQDHLCIWLLTKI